jgi:hypothetical protein
VHFSAEYALFLMNKTALALLALTASFATAEDNKPSPVGYSDTPVIPGTQWKVHDIDRPRPPVIQPGAKPGAAPSDAIVLFDGKNGDAFRGKDGAACAWAIENGEFLVKGGDHWTKQEFASCQFHIEWMSDPKTVGNSQKKGNAGVFFMDRYEVQIVDAIDNPTYADGHPGAIYGQTPPSVTATHKAGQWQTYDIVFLAPKLDGGKVIEPARVTVLINGVAVQNNTLIMGPTQHKKTTSYDGKFPEKAPIRIQDHKNEPPVRLRNIWVRPL